MQSEEERGGGSDHAYDKMGDGKKNQERLRRGGGVCEGKCSYTVCGYLCIDAGRENTQTCNIYMQVNQHFLLLDR